MPYRWLISWALIFRLYVARRIFALYSSVRSWDASKGESSLDESVNPSPPAFRSSSTWNTPAPSATSMLDGRIELDPFSVDFLVDIELELDLEDPSLVHQLGGFQEGSVQLHRLSLRRRHDLGDIEETRFLELVDLPVTRCDRDVIFVANLLDGSRCVLGRDQNALRVLVREQSRDVLFSHWSRFSRG